LACQWFTVATGHLYGSGGHPLQDEEIAMTNALGFDALKGILGRRLDPLPDHRKPGRNTRYTIKEAALGAVASFTPQSPSFLADQQHLQQAQGRNHACTLVGVAQIPCHKQVCNLLAPLIPRDCNGMDLQGFEHHGWLRKLRVLSDQLLVTLEGPQDHAS
jgi:hypothetical protein